MSKTNKERLRYKQNHQGKKKLYVTIMLIMTIIATLIIFWVALFECKRTNSNDDNVNHQVSVSGALEENNPGVKSHIMVSSVNQIGQLAIPDCKGIEFDNSWTIDNNIATISCHWSDDSCPSNNLWVDLTSIDNKWKGGAMLDIVNDASKPYVLGSIDRPVEYGNGSSPSATITFKGYSGFDMSVVDFGDSTSAYYLNLVSMGIGGPDYEDHLRILHFGEPELIRSNNELDISVVWDGLEDDAYLDYSWSTFVSTSRGFHELFIPITPHKFPDAPTHDVIVDDPTKFNIDKMNDFWTLYGFGFDNNQGLAGGLIQALQFNSNRKYIFPKNSSLILPKETSRQPLPYQIEYIPYIVPPSGEYFSNPYNCSLIFREDIEDYTDTYANYNDSEVFGYQGIFEVTPPIDAFSMYPTKYRISNKLFASCASNNRLNNSECLHIPLHADYFLTENGITYAHRQYQYYQPICIMSTNLSQSYTPHIQIISMIYDKDTEMTHYSEQMLVTLQNDFPTPAYNTPEPGPDREQIDHIEYCSVTLINNYQYWKTKGITTTPGVDAFSITNTQGDGLINETNMPENDRFNFELINSASSARNKSMTSGKTYIFNLSFDIQNLDS